MKAFSSLREAYHKLPSGQKERLGKVYRYAKRKHLDGRNLLKRGTPDFFSHIIIETNTSCNRRCEYCPNSAYERGLAKNERLMEERLFRKATDELSSIGYDGLLSLSFYNEPLLDKRIVEFTKYARDRLPEANIMIVTNGDYLTPGLFGTLVKAGVSGFHITQHSRDMGDNVKKTFASLGIDPREIQRKVKSRDVFMETSGVYIKYTHYNDDSKLYNRGGLVKPKKTDYEPICKSIGFIPVIDAEGDILLCCNDYFGSVKFGNIREDSIVGAWNSTGYKSVRKQISKGEYKLEVCKKCVGKA